MSKIRTVELGDTYPKKCIWCNQLLYEEEYINHACPESPLTVQDTEIRRIPLESPGGPRVGILANKYRDDTKQ